MSYYLYEKPFKKPEEIIEKLRSMNLNISDESAAKQFLTHINYFRFKIYLRPFLEDCTRVYKSGSTFEAAVELYRFDDELRDVLFSLIGRIEIKLRTRIDQVISLHLNNPFWYLDDRVLRDHNLIKQINSAFVSSRDAHVEHYKEKYFNNLNNSFKNLPPFWAVS